MVENLKPFVSGLPQQETLLSKKRLDFFVEGPVINLHEKNGNLKPTDDDLSQLGLFWLKWKD